MRRFLSVIAIVLASVVVGSAQQPGNFIVPTAPPGTNNNQAASTAFVQRIVTSGGGCSPASGICLDSLTGFSGLGLMRRTGGGTYTFGDPVALGTEVGGTLAAANFPALTGAVTTSGGSLATTLAIAQAGAHTWAGTQTFTLAPAFTDAAGSRAALGLAAIAASGSASDLTNGIVAIARGGTGQGTAATARGSSGLNIDQMTTNGNSNYTILATDRTVVTSATFTASRTWTLPAANAVNAGQQLIVADLFGGVTGVNALIISRAGSDTINGGTAVTIAAANGSYALWSDGTSKWTAQALGTTASGLAAIANSGSASDLISGLVAIARGGCNSPTGCVVATKVTSVTSPGTIARATGVKFAIVECYGGGAGGGGVAGSTTELRQAGGGGAGGYAKGKVNAPAGDYVVTIGAAGAGGAAGVNNGVSGGTTSLVVNGVTICSASGGSPGLGTTTSGLGGLGGNGAVGDVLGSGQAGFTGAYYQAADTALLLVTISVGGSTLLGAGGRAGAASGGTASVGSVGVGFGCGGGGATATSVAANAAGGNGCPGVVVITEFTNQ